MLLFVRKEFQDRIKSGEKPYEIRAGKRYRNVRPGDLFSINGRFKVRVKKVEEFSNRRDFFRHPLVRPVFFRDCYPEAEGPYFVFHIERV